MKLLGYSACGLIAMTVTVSALAQSGSLENTQASTFQVDSSGADLGKNKYMNLLIGLNVDNFIQDISADKNINFDPVIDQLLRDIGEGYIKGTVGRGRLGQISIYVSEEGLRRLRGHPLVRSIQPATNRGNIHDPSGLLSEVEEAIKRNGSATIGVVIEHKTKLEDAKNGALNETQAINRKQEFLDSLHAENYLGLSIFSPLIPAHEIKYNLGADTSVLVHAKIEGLYELKNRDDIRSIRLVNPSTGEFETKNRKIVHLDPVAIAEAEKTGSATVFIHLQRNSTYTPLTSRLTKDELEYQQKVIQEILTEIVEKVEPGSSGNLRFFEGIASGIIQLQLNSLRKLYENPDSRIERINNNSPLATISLNVSTASGQGVYAVPTSVQLDPGYSVTVPRIKFN